MADDVYGSTVSGGLKLKGVSKAGIKKKKKTKKNKAEEVKTLASSEEKQLEQEEDDQTVDSRTPAEIAFEKVQEKRAAERILKKASKTHKQRVEDLNKYLDGLSEHYDIQKVSWTK